MAHGIDLGTTNSLLATLDNTGRPVIIEDNTTALPALPSAIYFGKDSVYVGGDAKSAALEQPERVCQYFKRWIGRNDDPNRQVYMIDGEEKDPIQLSALVLGRMKEYAEANGETVDKVVITVPAYFSLAQRAATKDAGRIAGLNVLATINEPTAAALAYCHGSLAEEQNVLVYDLGGGTFDISLLRMNVTDTAYSADVLYTAGSAELGGKDWDDCLFTLMQSKVAEANGMGAGDLSEQANNDIRAMVEDTKFRLTRLDEHDVRVAADGMTTRITITRAEFDAATAHLLQQSESLLDAVLTQAAQDGINDEQIHMVLRVGGSSRMRQVEEMLTRRFGSRVRFYDPDKSVAMGAAIAADILERGADLKAWDVVVSKLDPNSSILQYTPRPAANPGDGPSVSDGNDSLRIISDSGESLDIPVDTLSDDVAQSVRQGTATVTEVIRDIRRQATVTLAPPLHDLTPSTFGVIIRTGEDVHVCDNFIHKDTPTPVAPDPRTYAVPEGDYEVLVLPVVESISSNPRDSVTANPDGTYTFQDYSLNSQVRGTLELPLHLFPNLKPRDPVYVTVRFDNLANLHVEMFLPTIGETRELDVNFSNISDAIMEQWKRAQAATTYAAKADY